VASLEQEICGFRGGGANYSTPGPTSQNFLHVSYIVVLATFKSKLITHFVFHCLQWTRFSASASDVIYDIMGIRQTINNNNNNNNNIIIIIIMAVMSAS